VAGPLHGIRILDLSRILAGPTCTQLLGDLGADVIKIERPGAGDDTRKWGPPYVTDQHGQDTTESAYYLCANRNKRSVAIDISCEPGQRLVRDLARHCDVFIENFKVGALAKYNLDYDTINESSPGIVYCSITGFGQTGPYAHRAGYDFLIQGMGGIMSITGESDGKPMKVGVGIADVMCGMYAAVAILAALRHRQATGDGQYIDMSLLDSQVAWLINSGLNYLTSGQAQTRLGNAHPNIVPYQLFATADGHIILAVGNDAQFQRFCEFAGSSELATDDRFSNNTNRVRHRQELVAIIEQLTREKPSSHWLQGLEARGVPCGPVNNLEEVFADPQIQHREMQISMPHPLAGTGSVDLIGSPVRLSKTPVEYRNGPPTLGQHTEEVLQQVLGMDSAQRDVLRQQKVIA